MEHSGGKVFLYRVFCVVHTLSIFVGKITHTSSETMGNTLKKQDKFLLRKVSRSVDQNVYRYLTRTADGISPTMEFCVINESSNYCVKN